MNRNIPTYLLACLLVVLLAACGDDYHYPSVRQEFLTVNSGPDGSLTQVVTDAGEKYAVLRDAANWRVDPNTSVRVVSNYAVEEVDGNKGVVLYAMTQAIAPVPLPEEQFEDGVVTDPAGVLSVWPGLDYLNIVLELKVQDGTHTFHFIEQSNVPDEASACRRVSLMLYHDDGDDAQSYTRRAYLSVPLAQYLTDGMESVELDFALNTYDGEVEHYRFVYP